jgi:hypothetical protein
MGGSCSTGQSPQRTVVPVEKKKKKKKKKNNWQGCGRRWSRYKTIIPALRKSDKDDEELRLEQPVSGLHFVSDEFSHAGRQMLAIMASRHELHELPLTY